MQVQTRHGGQDALLIPAMSLLVSILIGFVLSSLIGLVAWRRGSLTAGGTLGAILTGTAIFGFGGLVPGLLLVAFFVSSTFLSHYQARAKQQVNDKFQKGSRRDLGQALANGGWAALLAIGYWYADWIQADERLQVSLFAGLVGALATVTADTWATEIGVLSRSAPRMLTTGRIVPAGTSGAITLLGSITAFVGGTFIGVIALIGLYFSTVAGQTIGLYVEILSGPSNNGWLIVLVAGVSGLFGALFDSFLGATVQAIYFSEYDESQTERRLDSQGNPTRLVRGWRWLDNDWVNFFASVFGSLFAAALAVVVL